MSDLREVLSDPDDVVRCMAAVEAELEGRTRMLCDQLADSAARVEALSATVRRKDDDLRAKEAVVLRKDDDLRGRDDIVRQKDDDLRAKDRAMAIKDDRLHLARDRSEQLQADLSRVEADLKEATSDLLHARGKLNMRGVVEYIEDREQGRMGFPRDTARAVKSALKNQRPSRR